MLAQSIGGHWLCGWIDWRLERNCSSFSYSLCNQKSLKFIGRVCIFSPLIFRSVFFLLSISRTHQNKVSINYKKLKFKNTDHNKKTKKNDEWTLDGLWKIMQNSQFIFRQCCQMWISIARLLHVNGGPQWIIYSFTCRPLNYEELHDGREFCEYIFHAFRRSFKMFFRVNTMIIIRKQF